MGSESEEQSEQNLVDPVPLPPEETSEDLDAARTLTNHAISWEMLAVMSFGIILPLIDAFLILGMPVRETPYWIDSVELTARSICTAFLVLYLIHRSGEPWAKFGIVRPGLSDLVFASLFFCAAYVVWHVAWQLMPWLHEKNHFQFSLPRQRIDYLLMVVKFTASAFAEEMVCRGYLVTRLRQLLGWRVTAVGISAFLFASYHLYQGMVGIVYAFILGVVFGFLFLLVPRIWPLALAHFLLNVRAELLLAS